MNKLKTSNTGGMPFELDDIRWEQDAISDVLKGILDTFKPAGASGFILNGCTVTAVIDRYKCTAGYVYFNNEVFKVDYHEVLYGSLGCHYVFAIDISYDSTGHETFLNNSSYDTYEIRKAKLIVNTDVPFTAGNFTQHDALSLQDNAWHFVGETNEPAFWSNWDNSNNSQKVSFKKDLFGNVFLRGLCEIAQVSAINTIFQLPVGFRPAQSITFFLDKRNLTTLTILSSGEVMVWPDVEFNPAFISFDFLNFKNT